MLWWLPKALSSMVSLVVVRRGKGAELADVVQSSRMRLRPQRNQLVLLCVRKALGVVRFLDAVNRHDEADLGPKLGQASPRKPERGQAWKTGLSLGRAQGGLIPARQPGLLVRAIATWNKD